jgi:hypothetical protein
MLTCCAGPADVALLQVRWDGVVMNSMLSNRTDEQTGVSLNQVPLPPMGDDPTYNLSVTVTMAYPGGTGRRLRQV